MLVDYQGTSANRHHRWSLELISLLHPPAQNPIGFAASNDIPAKAAAAADEMLMLIMILVPILVAISSYNPEYYQLFSRS